MNRQPSSNASSVVIRFRLSKASAISTATAQQEGPATASMDAKHKLKNSLSNLCHVRFLCKKDLHRHLKKAHNYHHHHHAFSKEKVPELKPTTSHDSSSACSLCGKTFTSYRALCGHMRTHPERERQVIKPPTPPSLDITPRSSSSISSRVSVSQREDGSRSSCTISAEVPTSPGLLNLKWAATARRGRKALINLRKQELICHPVVDETATNLGPTHDDSAPPDSSLSLLKDPSHVVPDMWNKRKEKEPLETAERDFSSKRQKVDDKSKVVPKYDLITDFALKKREPYSEGHCGSRIGVFDLNEVNEEVIEQKLHTEQEHAADNKDWGSFLSLGVSGDLKQVNQHGSEREYAADTKDMGRFLSVAVARKKNKNLKGKGNGVSLSRSASTHRCEICDRSFPTGWALGGHKRLHWVAPQVESHVGVTNRISSLVSQEQVNSRLLVAS